MAQAVALGLDVVGFGFDHAGGEGLVVDRAVVALGVVLDRNLPVALFRDFHPLQRRQPVDFRDEGTQLFTHPRKPVIHGRGVVVEIDENEAVKDLRAHRGQADFGLGKVWNRADVRPGTELAGQLVSPGVVGADDQRGMTAAADQLVRPVLADVEEGPHLTVAIAQAEQVFSRHFKGKVVAGFGHLADVTSELPGSHQQPGALGRENLRVGVVAPFERADDGRGLVHGQKKLRR